MNPAWNESTDSAKVDVSQLRIPEEVLPISLNGISFQALFAKASNLTGEEFLNRFDYYAKAWMPARDIVITALSNRKAVHPSGHIIVFDKFAPWKVTFFKNYMSDLPNR